MKGVIMGKKLAATEEEIAVLHKLITRCHNMKLDAMLEMADAFKEMNALESVSEVLNLRDLGVIQKWIEYNGVAAIAASENGETELGKKLRLLKEAQKGKVVPFKETGTED